mmetsp:Transcript_24132/g.47964  ORF Transcript_24132/g.47964 Transcript_24132/m.47964 type:complete len:1128 (-) Transcript_24132:52-3435(-)
MIALLQIIRQPLLLLLVLFSCDSSEYVSINSAAAFALSTQSQHGRTQHHQVVHSSNTVGAFCTQVGLPITISRSSHRLYSSRLAATSSNSHDDDADPPCTVDNSIHSDCNPASLISKEQRTTTIIQPPLLKSSSSSSSSLQQTDRRTALLQLLSISLLTISSLQPSQASELDSSTGELFSPKNQMIKGGGSIGGRGIPLKEQRAKNEQSLLKTSGLIQSVYETRFITYLTRFLLVYDPAARAWWKKNRARVAQLSSSPDGTNTTASIPEEYFNAGEQFAEFAESVEIGLADYFLGPYGSYASVAAAKAGLGAVAPARSSAGDNEGGVKKGGGMWESIFGGGKEEQSSTSTSLSSSSKKKKKKSDDNANEEVKQNRQGVLNLFTLLSTRYTSMEEKQQLAILFSLISKPELQPVKEIKGLLGEIDNGTIAEIQLEVEDVLGDSDISRDYFRLSSRQGGGFASSDAQVISIEPPAPLGDDYRPAKIQTIMKPTSRILRINVVDGGEGYPVAPDVIVKQSGVSRQCEAVAIIDRKGSVSEVIVLNPGFGYGGSTARGQPTIPTVEFRERIFARQKKKKSNNGSSPKKVKPAKAVVELEYQVAGATILDGGSGYSFDSPPDVKISLPATDPDWFVAPNIYGQSMDDDENQYIAARVTKIKRGGSGVILDTDAAMRGGIGQRVTRDILRTVLRDPVALLPPSVRPELSIDKGTAFYSIKSLPRPPSKDVILPSNYRSIDPLFGGIGRAPVTKNQVTLSADQYSRLALSGAICTVLVRTALNPLELVKTKVQLGNDEEIIQYAREKAGVKSESSQPEDKPALGTTQVIQSLIEVRGPLSLFQSADVTFLASVVFGLFGFGATELFRRAFSAVFFDEAAAAANSPNEFVLLTAAGVATVLTCAAASPFELLRVRSMAQIENEGVKEIFDGFVDQNRQKRGMKTTSTSATAASASSSAMVATKGLQLDDIKPFWSSFYPIVSRELPFAVTKFLVFDLAAGNIAGFINNSNMMGSDTKIQVGVGSAGLLLSAFSGALAGIAGAFVSHPADLILTLTSASSRQEGEEKDWRVIVKELLSSDGGVLNLYAGFPARAVFFFLVIGAQFFLYDYVKTLLEVGTDDLTLVLDVFYAIRQGL